MPSVPNATFYSFVGSYAFSPLTPVPSASQYLFTGAVAFPALSSVSSSTFYAFVGEMDFASITTIPWATFYTFNKVNESAGPAVGTGIVLYPISEDPSQRPILRY